MEDTITAISTAFGIGAISIIRISGLNAIEIVDQIWDGSSLKTYPSHTIHYGHIVDGTEIIDEVLLSIMKAPRTYTKEDVIEINCHGGLATTNRILELLILKGARLAEPGEFTKRAFLNGRIDLSQAEGVMDLINAQTEESRDLAIHQVGGSVTKMISELRSKISQVISNIEANIDYPEYDDIEVLTNEKIKPTMLKIKQEMQKILRESQNGILLKDGIKVSIIGRPNVGKSSLLNKLLEEEKAIVTDVEGTTRDIVEGSINLDGLRLNIIDTAGIRSTEDIVEKIGVEKSKKLIDESDLILFVLSNNEILNEEEKQILSQLQNKNYILIINKTDLSTKLESQELPKSFIRMSLSKNEGIEELKQEIKRIFQLEKIKTKDFTYLTNARSIAILKQACFSLEEVLKGIENHMPIDMVEIDLKELWNLLGQIIGESYEEELLDNLFQQFCLGK